MTTMTQLQHYAREALRSAVYVETEHGVHAYIPDLVGVQADAGDEREAHNELWSAFLGWFLDALSHGQYLPPIGGVDLNSPYAQTLLRVEHGIANNGAAQLDALHQASQTLVDAYVHYVQHSDLIDAVYVEEQPGSTRIFTLYHGDRDQVSPMAYQAQGQMYERFPDITVRFDLVNTNLVDRASLSQLAREAFVRT